MSARTRNRAGYALGYIAGVVLAGGLRLVRTVQFIALLLLAAVPLWLAVFIMSPVEGWRQLTGHNKRGHARRTEGVPTAPANEAGQGRGEPPMSDEDMQRTIDDAIAVEDLMAQCGTRAALTVTEARAWSRWFKNTPYATVLRHKAHHGAFPVIAGGGGSNQASALESWPKVPNCRCIIGPGHYQEKRHDNGTDPSDGGSAA